MLFQERLNLYLCKTMIVYQQKPPVMLKLYSYIFQISNKWDIKCLSKIYNYNFEIYVQYHYYSFYIPILVHLQVGHFFIIEKHLLMQP